MSPKLQSGTDGQASFKPGIVTCTAATYSDESRLAFIVQTRIALVLDRQNLDEGQIIGMLCENDVACASLVELPWVMVPEGSSVRHPTAREGRIRLQRDGWMITRHPTFGELLTPFSAERLRRHFDEDTFAKLPVVKIRPKAKAKVAAVEPSETEAVPAEAEASRREAEALLQSCGDAAEAASREAAAAEAAATAEAPAEAAAAAVPPARRQAAATDAARRQVAIARLEREAGRRERETAKLAGRVGDTPVVPSTAEDRLGASASTADPPTAAAVKQPAKKAAAKKGFAMLPDRVKAPAEMLDSHLRMCTGEHWKVVHDFVFLREMPSTSSEHLGVLRRGAVFCLAALPGDSALETRSPDGKWVRCGKEAKVWPKVETTEPEFLFKGDAKRLGAYVLIRNEEHGDLLRLVPNTKLDIPVVASKDPLKQDGPPNDANKPKAELEPKAEPVSAEEMAKLEHWVVESSSAKVFVSRDEQSTVVVALNEGDLVTLGSSGWNRTWSDESGKAWLLFPPGAQVYRNLQPRFPASGYKHIGYILVQDAEAVLAREYKPPETGVTVCLVSGYGEPWVVEHEQVVVRRGPSTSDVPVGIMLKGDVVGVGRKEGDWVELTQDSDVRFRKKGTAGTEAGSTFLNSVNPLRETKVDEEALKRRKDGGLDPLPVPARWRGEPPTRAWMLVDHPSLGQLLRRARKRKGGLASGVVISQARSDLYREVVELCHRRIYEENLESLWDGDREKLPTAESIEAKLFDSQASVVHVTREGTFCGGAIIRQVSVRAKQLEGSSNLNLTGMVPGTERQELPGRTEIGYIDSCAAVPGSGGGRVLWDAISSLRFACVTCHSILLQKTVDFWQTCGMRRLDPTSERDCEEFRKNILVHTMGKLVCELADVERELPSSKLPLFVWVPSRISQASAELDSDHLFTPDDPEAQYL